DGDWSEMICCFNEASSLDIVHYVPKRRLTFQSSTARGELVIGKFTRRPRAAEAYERLAKVARAVQCSRPTFSVAAPIGIVESRNLFFQEARPGNNLATVLNQHNFIDLLRSVGLIHGQMHSLAPQDLPAWDQSRCLESVATAIQWISFLRPEHAPLLRGVWNSLLSHAPPIQAERYVFCHGDFGCSQVLQRGGQWSVIDFDLCVRGDPCWEVA